MLDRSITEQEVMECLANYAISYTDKKGNPIYKAIVKNRGIKVVVSKEDHRFVITAADF
jgi:hypothetical protein